MSKLWSSFLVDWHCTLQVGRSKSGSGNNKHIVCANEDYCKIPLPYGHRSVFAKFRCGVAPLIVETGRYENVKLKDRVCPFCKDATEDEVHALLNCPFF